MDSAFGSHPEDGIPYWQERWEDGHLNFHKKDVHEMLERHVEKLMPDRKPNKILIPLCGKSVDMKWLADKGFTVVGVEGVQMALEQFFAEQGVESVKDTDNPNLIKSKDGKIRLYCSDMLQFSPDTDGNFDTIWDRGSMVALERKCVPRYVDVLKSLLRPGGRILTEVFEFDVAIMSDVPDGPTKPPPPHPMYFDEIKKLYGPECIVEEVDRSSRQLFGKEIGVTMYLISKKS